MADNSLQLTPDRIAALGELKVAVKFLPEPSSFYPGAPTEDVRAECEARINELVDRLLFKLQPDPRKAVALSEFENALRQFGNHDSEERDRVCSYLEQIMDILGIESSDGLLNRWRYGFDPN